MFGLKANSLQLKCHETLQIAVIEKQVQFKILVTNLHTHLLADKGKSVAKFHEEHPQIAEQSGLQVGLAVPFRQVEEVKQVLSQ